MLKVDDSGSWLGVKAASTDDRKAREHWEVQSRMTSTRCHAV